MYILYNEFKIKASIRCLTIIYSLYLRMQYKTTFRFLQGILSFKSYDMLYTG